MVAIYRGAWGGQAERGSPAADVRWSGARRREVLRAREEFCRLFFDDRVPADSARGLREYFLRFGVLARREAGRAV
ncbi:MAG TPA: hypothetical protein VMT93_03580 [Gemmatimonadaceae bacterium]|nr:hypothetical protein [Gemmatimonadaceae bacterium]